MAYNIITSDDSCYDGTSVLINKFDIKNQDLLSQAETNFVLLHSAEIRNSTVSEPFTFPFYCSLHKRLFGDIYSWAGELRKVDFSKKGTNFYPSADLAQLGKAKFDYLQRHNEFSGMERREYVKEIASFYHELNMLHPFREGNGRTQRLFFSLLIQRNGFDIDFSRCDRELLMTAVVYAAQGVGDLLEKFFDLEKNFDLHSG